MNAHALPGPGIISGLHKVVEDQEKGLLILAEMSSKGNLATKEYTDKALEMANQNTDFVIGFISIDPASWKTRPGPEFIHMTPGVNLESKVSVGKQNGVPLACFPALQKKKRLGESCPFFLSLSLTRTQGDNLGQQYNTPAIVIGKRESDVIIVGRGITQADDPAAAAKLYKDEGWKAYEQALHA